MMSWLQRFLSGRYGTDQLGVAMIGLYLLLVLIATITQTIWLQFIAYPLFFYIFFRILSKNHATRRRENEWFLKWARPIYTKIARTYTRIRREVKDRDHRYFSCPTCKSLLQIKT